MSHVYVINWRIKCVNFQFCWFEPHQGSMYWEGTVSNSNFWNNILHVVLALHLVIILINIFCSLKIFFFLISPTMWNGSHLQHTNTCLLTYSVEQSLSWEAIQFSAILEIPSTFYGIWRFITGFTSACHLSLPKVSVQV